MSSVVIKHPFADAVLICINARTFDYMRRYTARAYDGTEIDYIGNYLNFDEA